MTSLLKCEDPSPDPFFEGASSSAFFPENIFWDPQGKSIEKNWLPFWRKSLSLGWRLLKAGYQQDLKWFEGAFLQQLDDLREEVKGALFRKETKEVRQA